MKYVKPIMMVIDDSELKDHIVAAASQCYYVCCQSGK